MFILGYHGGLEKACLLHQYQSSGDEHFRDLIDLMVPMVGGGNTLATHRLVAIIAVDVAFLKRVIRTNRKCDITVPVLEAPDLVVFKFMS